MPIIHISRPGVSDEETDRLVQAGQRVGVFRQCAIGYHEECSDPDGDECKCICHTEGGAETRPAKKESIVCPYCGMSTWVEGRCTLPGCEGSNVLNDGFGDG